jgi:hypothetical protein
MKGSIFMSGLEVWVGGVEVFGWFGSLTFQMLHFMTSVLLDGGDFLCFVTYNMYCDE